MPRPYAHNLNRETWVHRFKEELISRAGLREDRSADAADMLCDAELETWPADQTDEFGWLYVTPEEAVEEALSNWTAD